MINIDRIKHLCELAIQAFGADDGIEQGEPLESADIAALYRRRPSFLKYLPIREYVTETGTFLHEDGISHASIFSIVPVDADGRSDDYLQSIRAGITDALHVLPNRLKDQYIVQVYVRDEPYRDVEQWLRDYVHPRARGTKITEQYLEQLTRHLKQVSSDGGIFEDGGAIWKGKRRIIRCVLYRKFTKADLKAKAKPADEVNEVTDAVLSMLQGAGVNAQRVNGVGYYQWLFPWFNPAPEATSGDPYEYLDQRPYPLEDENEGTLPISFDLSAFCFSQEPKSIDPISGAFSVSGGCLEYISLAPISQKPRTGVWGLDEKKDDGSIMASLLDSLPEGSVLCMTIVALDQHLVDQRAIDIERQTGGKTDSANEESNQATIQVNQYRTVKANEARIYKLNIGIYLTGLTQKQLAKRRKKTIQVMTKHHLPAIEATDDLVKQNSFLTQLPMSYDPAYDIIEERSGHAYTHHISSLLPFYGKSRGTGHPGFLFFNGSGELLSFDPFNKMDRKRTAHGLLLGPSGAGKSAMSTYLIEHLLAIYRPRFYIVESGDSFGPLALHLKANDVNVRHVKLSANSDVGLSPFSDAIKALEQFECVEDQEAAVASSIDLTEDFIDKVDAGGTTDDDAETRDILGEMELAARLMITGGEDKEEARMIRPDRLLIRNAILDAAKHVRDRTDRNEVVLTDIIDAFMRIVGDSDVKRHVERAQDMADSLKLFSSGVEGRFFNQPGDAWPADADVTIVDLDLFARKGNEDKLAVVMTGLLNRINGIAEAKQKDGRPIVVWIDEAHIATTNPLLAPYIATIGKMWRKLKTWLWLATQNMKDFPDVASKMLSMAEFWICLSPPKDEIEKMAVFKNLSAEEKYMMLHARKELPKFVEGVVLSPTVTAKFKNIPPTRSLALAMTEGDEKEERGIIMAEKNIEEHEAAYVVAERIYQARETFRKSQNLNYDE